MTEAETKARERGRDCHSNVNVWNGNNNPYEFIGINTHLIVNKRNSNLVIKGADGISHVLCSRCGYGIESVEASCIPKRSGFDRAKRIGYYAVGHVAINLGSREAKERYESRTRQIEGERR